jgi:hypothetical protein
MLRFTTAGSVDDGKSTLIGRLLHDYQECVRGPTGGGAQEPVNRSGGPWISRC